MKQKIKFISFLIGMLFIQESFATLSPINADDKGIQFEKGTLKEALSKAEQQKKQVFLDCYTSWCGPCKIMSNDVFPLEEVGKFFNQRFISIKIDMEKGEGKDLLKKYQIKAYPTMLVLDSKGHEIARILGRQDADELIYAIKKLTQKEFNLASIEKAYKDGDHSPEMTKKYLFVMQKAGKLDRRTSFDQFAQFVKTFNDEDFCKNENFFYIKQAVYSSDKTIGDRLVNLFPKMNKEMQENAVSIFKSFMMKYLNLYSWGEKNDALNQKVKQMQNLFSQENKDIQEHFNFYNCLKENNAQKLITFFKTHILSSNDDQLHFFFDMTLFHLLRKSNDPLLRKEAIDYLKESKMKLPESRQKSYDYYLKEIEKKGV